MTLNIQPVICEISKLELGPNDVLVIKLPKEDRIENLDRIAEALRDMFDSSPLLRSIPTMVFAGDVEISVVRKSDE